MEQHMQYLMWLKSKEMYNNKFQASWEEEAFAEDASGRFIWPPRSYTCTFCKREFRSAQALGGHMNVHRRDRARLKVQSTSSSSSSSSSSLSPQPHVVHRHSDSSPNYSSISSTSKASSQHNNINPLILSNSPLSDTCSNSGKFLSLSNQIFQHGGDHDDAEVVDTKLSVGLLSLGYNYDSNYSKKRRVMRNDHIISTSLSRNVFQTVVLGSTSINTDQSIDLELRLGDSQYQLSCEVIRDQVENLA